MDRAQRAAVHAALGDDRRLTIVDALELSDMTVAELGALVDMNDSLLAHHLGVLADAGVIERRVSEGDHRRRYVTLDRSVLLFRNPVPRVSARRIAFVCTHNSARSQFASALWEQTSGAESPSAGTEPAEQVHPMATKAARTWELDLSTRTPGGYDLLPSDLDLVVTVCDRARETELPPAAEYLHWSIPDPVPAGTEGAFHDAFSSIATRLDRLAGTSS